MEAYVSGKQVLDLGCVNHEAEKEEEKNGSTEKSGRRLPESWGSIMRRKRSHASKRRAMR